MEGKRYVPKQMKHSIMPMKQSCWVNGENPGCQHPEGVIDRRGVGERLTPWSSGAGGKGDGTGHTRAAPPPRRRRALCWCSCCLLTVVAGFKASVSITFPFRAQHSHVDRRQTTHPSGWTCRAGKPWVAELAWVELPFRWIRLVEGGWRER
jgi:hypothetical protein